MEDKVGMLRLRIGARHAGKSFAHASHISTFWRAMVKENRQITGVIASRNVREGRYAGKQEGPQEPKGHRRASWYQQAMKGVRALRPHKTTPSKTLVWYDECDYIPNVKFDDLKESS